MKTIKKRTEITVRTSRLLVINRHSSLIHAVCKACGKEVEMITPDEAAALVGVSSRVIYRAIEAGELHFLELPTLFICRDSLQAQFANSRELVESAKPTT